MAVLRIDCREIRAGKQSIGDYKRQEVRVSQSWHLQHLGLDNSLFWRAALCIVGSLVASLASTY